MQTEDKLYVWYLLQDYQTTLKSKYFCMMERSPKVANRALLVKFNIYTPKCPPFPPLDLLDKGAIQRAVQQARGPEGVDKMRRLREPQTVRWDRLKSVEEIDWKVFGVFATLQILEAVWWACGVDHCQHYWQEMVEFLMYRGCVGVVDRPTQLICITDIYLLLYVNIQIQKT